MMTDCAAHPSGDNPLIVGVLTVIPKLGGAIAMVVRGVKIILFLQTELKKNSRSACYASA